MRGQTIVYVANAVALVAQFGSAIALAVLALVGTLSLRLPLTQSYLRYDPDGATAAETLDAGALNPTWLLVAMCVLTGLNHGLVLIPPVFRVYFRLGEAGFNVFSWVEYTFTSSLMALVLLLLTGVSELSTAIPLASLLGFTNLLGGLLPEMLDYLTARRLPKWIVFWLPAGITGALSLLPWVTIVAYFVASALRSDVAVPLWLWFSFAGTFFNFNAFAFVFVAQHLDLAFARRYRWIWMLNYTLLSLFSKLYLTWFFAGGILSRS
jgi:hypothetical protein